MRLNMWRGLHIEVDVPPCNAEEITSQLDVSWKDTIHDIKDRMNRRSVNRVGI